MEPDVEFSIFGWILASFSFGRTTSIWFFGFWNQKTMSIRYPVSCGLAFMAAGNLIYFTLPAFTENHSWFMLLARFVAGIGSGLDYLLIVLHPFAFFFFNKFITAGNLVVLRAYCAMASLQRDRTRAMSLAVGTFIGGLSFGPFLQVCL